ITLGGFVWMLNREAGDIFNPDDEHVDMARTMAFFVLATAQLFHVAAIHAGNASFIEAPLWKNPLLFWTVNLTILLQMAAIYVPFLQDLLNTRSLPLEAFLVGLVLAFSIAPLIEIEKWIMRRQAHAENG
ncbi:MAG: cation transporting ATPase C-terminal domain-containing protein, partial [Anaerolineae bacterium]|nr:cation transporting ATPase C-terminal domain-containing protein [Anaerolineae bacterium]